MKFGNFGRIKPAVLVEANHIAVKFAGNNKDEISRLRRILGEAYANWFVNDK
jgi:hypothetical protein